MAKSKSKETVTLSKNGFIALLFFVIACSVLAAYAFLNYTV
jgi:hypothetical protein